jgi:hypothetical protein
VGSKEAKGGDPNIREEDRCLSIRRGFERRVKDRQKGDALRDFWSRLLADKQAMSKWLVKMKNRPANSPISDEQMHTYIDEFTKQYDEDKAQKNYYSYNHVIFDNPLLASDEHDRIWARLHHP